jgi:hypothetical protein
LARPGNGSPGGGGRGLVGRRVAAAYRPISRQPSIEPRRWLGSEVKSVVKPAAAAALPTLREYRPPGTLAVLTGRPRASASTAALRDHSSSSCSHEQAAIRSGWLHECEPIT